MIVNPVPIKKPVGWMVADEKVLYTSIASSLPRLAINV
jgi:hypothetical protein